MFRIAFILFACFTWSSKGVAQKLKKEDYFFIDQLIRNYGPLEGSSLQYIVDSVTRECTTELQVTRAFYRFQALWINIDTRRNRKPGKFTDNASTALMERKAGSEGFANMFKAMCDLKKIECSIVKGVLRRTGADIGSFNPDAVHYWNSVTIDHTQYLIDAAMGAGSLDRKGKFFTRTYTDAWWLANRKLFALSHYPDDPKMQLLEVPLTKMQFARAPIAVAGAIVAGIIPTAKGLIPGREDSSTVLKFNITPGLSITATSVSFNQGSFVQSAFDLDEFGFYIHMPNGPVGRHIAELYINNTFSFIFLTDIRKNTGKSKKH